MAVFDFPYHQCTWVYPKGDSFKFGKGYEFSSPPQLPIQRRFTLSFEALVWGSSDPQLSMNALVAFYEAHYTNVAFVYPHPEYGDINVKFAADAPFEVPKSLPGAGGTTDVFTLILVEQGV